jgi:hypothetical protein
MNPFIDFDGFMSNLKTEIIQSDSILSQGLSQRDFIDHISQSKVIENYSDI